MNRIDKMYKTISFVSENQGTADMKSAVKKKMNEKPLENSIETGFYYRKLVDLCSIIVDKYHKGAKWEYGRNESRLLNFFVCYRPERKIVHEERSVVDLTKKSIIHAPQGLTGKRLSSIKEEYGYIQKPNGEFVVVIPIKQNIEKKEVRDELQERVAKLDENSI